MPREIPAWRAELERERAARDTFLARDRESPFTVGRIRFRPLRYFPPDPSWVVAASLERREPPGEAWLRTNFDNQAEMRYLGDLCWERRGEAHRLAVYHAGSTVGPTAVIPFRDRTSGRESFGPGRYLTLALKESDRYQVDFNRAFNPYCAYTDAYECPLPPPENDLPVAVRAGEKVWDPDRNPRSPGGAIREREQRLLRARR